MDINGAFRVDFLKCVGQTACLKEGRNAVSLNWPSLCMAISQDKTGLSWIPRYWIE